MSDTTDDQPGSDAAREQEAHDAQTLELPVVYAAVLKEGEFELNRPLQSLVWSSLAAGLSMGFSMVGEGILRDGLPRAPWAELLSKLGYAFGFLLVILGRQQLFTENTLTVMLPLLSKPSWHVFNKVAVLWAVVLVGNLLGVTLFTILSAYTQLFPAALQQTFVELGHEALAATPVTTFVRAVFGGWLIAMMVWMLPASEGSRVLVVLLVTTLVGLGHFAHVIAGSAETLFAVFRGDATLGQWMTHFLLPAFLGNSLGGTALVAGINHAQTRGA